MDELLTVIILSHYFPGKDFPQRWKNKKMVTFMHFVMEELFMLRKLALVQEIRNIDRDMAQLAAGRSLENPSGFGTTHGVRIGAADHARYEVIRRRSIANPCLVAGNQRALGSLKVGVTLLGEFVPLLSEQRNVR